MLPDDRLGDLLSQAERETRPGPEFLDRLFDDLLPRRRRRALRVGGWALPRPLGYSLAAPLVVVVAVAGILAVTFRGVPPSGVADGSASPRPTAVSTAS